MITTCNVGTASPYPVHIGPGLLHDTERISAYIHGSERLVIITDSTVRELYGHDLARRLQAHDPLLLSFPAGETHKTRETKTMLEDAMLSHGVNRDARMIVLGGGVASDLAGFVAATYCRGIPMLYFPTTLLAMVDAAVGGKTGVNTPSGKNLIGAFHQPQAVFMDVDTLTSQSQDALNNGLAEMLKHTLLEGPEALDELVQAHEANRTSGANGTRRPHGRHWLLADTARLIRLLAASVNTKIRHVNADERDTGARQLLNLGHTIGHAAEQLSGYSIPHGHAVLIGILVESYLSLRYGLLPEAELERIVASLSICGFPLKTPWLEDREAVLGLLKLDKKNHSHSIRCVLMRGVGDPCPEYTRPVDPCLIRAALDWYAALPEGK